MDELKQNMSLPKKINLNKTKKSQCSLCCLVTTLKGYGTEISEAVYISLSVLCLGMDRIAPHFTLLPYKHTFMKCGAPSNDVPKYKGTK